MGYFKNPVNGKIMSFPIYHYDYGGYSSRVGSDTYTLP